MSEIVERKLGPRGCGYPVKGGCYIESIGDAGGLLPRFVPIQPEVPYHFFRGVSIVAGDFILSQTEGSKDMEYERLKIMEAFAKHLFGERAKIVDGHAEQFSRELNLALDENGWTEQGGTEQQFEAAVERAKESAVSLRRLAPHVRA